MAKPFTVSDLFVAGIPAGRQTAWPSIMSETTLLSSATLFYYRYFVWVERFGKCLVLFGVLGKARHFESRTQLKS